MWKAWSESVVALRDVAFGKSLYHKGDLVSSVDALTEGSIIDRMIRTWWKL